MLHLLWLRLLRSGAVATIVPRKNQEGATIGWQATIRRRGFRTLTKTFRNKRDAEAWATITESEMVRGTWRDRTESENTTLSECLDRYLAEIVPTKKGGPRELDYVRQWKARPIATMFMANIRGKDIANSIREMGDEGKSANTIRLHLALISHLFNVAKREWGMENIQNPVDFVRKPKLPKGRDRRLVGDEEERLLTACAEINPELCAIVKFAIETAMRQGEIMAMTWDKVNLSSRTVTLDDTKNGEKRVVPLSSMAIKILEDLENREKGYLWRYKQEGVKCAFPVACRRAQISDLRFHDLRHEATSRFFEKGLNPMQVAAITGHKTLQMLKRYTHLRAEDLAKLLG
jgi:integrase